MKELPEGFRQKKNGQLEYRFSLAGRRRSVSGATVRECKAKAESLRTKDASGHLVDKNKITLIEYASEVIDRSQVKPTSKLSYHSWLKTLPAWLLSMRLQAIERRHIIMAQSELSERAAVASVNSTIGLLKQVFNEAMLDKIIAATPCLGIKSLKATATPASETVHRALTLDEQKRLFDELRRSDCWYLELFELQILTGMRIGEIIALHWSDITDTVIHVRATMSAGKYSESTKTASSRRDIPVTPAITRVLRSQRDKIITAYGLAAVMRSKQVFYKTTSAEGYVRPSSPSKALKRACKAAGVERICSHALRDTFATRAIEQGKQPNTLKVLLGHSSITMTMDLYAHVLPDVKNEAMHSLNIVI